MARIFITGSTDGLGREAARQLLELGHEVILHARSDERAKALHELMGKVIRTVIGDLSSGSEVRAIADQVNGLGPLDAVIHNAGVYTLPERGETPEGHPTTLAINTLAPYALTALIERPRRLIYLSSGLHRGGEGSLSDLDWRSRRWDGARAYAESKLHAVALANLLSRRWPEVFTAAVDPGWVRTRMGGRSAPVDLETGARTQSWLAVANDVHEQKSGRYWHALRTQQPAREALDQEFQVGLARTLEQLTGVTLP